MDTSAAGSRLRSWRQAREPKLTLETASERVGVSHPTWVDWEKGSRRPALDKAVALELLTEGAVPVEAWGFDTKAVADMAKLVSSRATAPRPAA